VCDVVRRSADSSISISESCDLHVGQKWNGTLPGADEALRDAPAERPVDHDDVRHCEEHSRAPPVNPERQRMRARSRVVNGERQPFPGAGRQDLWYNANATPASIAAR
jgi:hypothetical protein